MLKNNPAKNNRVKVFYAELFDSNRKMKTYLSFIL